MYLQFFGLTEAPFSLTPDPAFVYLSAAHRDALAHLLYGVGKGGAGGFVQLTGEVGTGKTTICRCLLEQVPDDTVLALVLNPMLTPIELLVTICEELRIEVGNFRDSSKSLVDALNGYLLKQHADGKRVVVVIDEAQNLSAEALEQVRLLTNLETAKHKLLQIVLLGQPELRQLLQRQNLRQLAQRITARYHLAPLGEKDTFAYVRHRMQVAGSRQNPFRRSALRALYRRSGGVPRLINIIADRALAGAYARESDRVDAQLVHAAANEVQPSETRVRRHRSSGLIATAAGLILVLVSVIIWGLPWSSRSPQSATGAVTPVTRSSTTLDSTQDSPDEPDLATHEINSPDSVNTLQAVAPVAVPAVEPRALEPDWLVEQDGLAWWGMANLWQDGSNSKSIQAACDGLPATGYACLRDQGSWERVKQLGLPVILLLPESGGKMIILRGLSKEEVLLGAGNDPVAFSRETLEPRWLGEYIVVWPQAPEWPLIIKKGGSGAAVDIVMQMAAHADPAWTGDAIFDSQFESWLIAFQRRHGLHADGIIGPRTLLYLMAPTIVEPRLQTAFDETE